VNYSRR